MQQVSELLRVGCISCSEFFVGSCNKCKLAVKICLCTTLAAASHPLSIPHHTHRPGNNLEYGQLKMRPPGGCTVGKSKILPIVCVCA